jgi:DNA-binding response OmpR family regulator
MSGVINLVIVQDDLSVPDVVATPDSTSDGSPNRRDLFDLLASETPEVIVLDCRGPARRGVEAIKSIRSKTALPVLAICQADDPLQRAYRMAGAADCLESPFDIQTFNYTLLEIVKIAGPQSTDRKRVPQSVSFDGIQFDPKENRLRSEDREVRLTGSEGKLLQLFVDRAWQTCTRAEIAMAVYGPSRPSSDRAIDAFVSRLREKLETVSPTTGKGLIKAEFRLGFMFIGTLADQTGVSD